MDLIIIPNDDGSSFSFYYNKVEKVPSVIKLIILMASSKAPNISKANNN